MADPLNEISLSRAPKGVAAEHVLLEESDLARMWAVSVSQLQKLRARGDGPPFHKIGHLCRYRLADVNEWVNAHRVRSTSEVAARQSRAQRKMHPKKFFGLPATVTPRSVVKSAKPKTSSNEKGEAG